MPAFRIRTPAPVLRISKLACISLATVVLSACSTHLSGPESGSNVLFLVIDALRADHLGSYGYDRETSPAMDRLAEEGFTFEAAIAASSNTRISMASLLTSLHPIEHGVRLLNRQGRLIGLFETNRDSIFGLEDNLTTMAEVFAANGYQTVGIVTNPFLKKEHGFAQGFQSYLEEELDAGEVVDHFLGFLEQRSERPFFAFLHFIDVHAPYDPPGAYGDLFLPRNDDPIQKIIGEYDGAIRYVDDELNRLLQRLKENRLLQNTLIALTSDHGEEFLDHGRRGHGSTLYDEAIRVPLIIHPPGDVFSGRRSTGTVSHLDVMPTLLELSGVPIPEGLSGRSLLMQMRGEEEAAPAAAFSEITVKKHRKESIRTDRYKLIRTRNRSPVNQGEKPDTPRGAPVVSEFELYDLGEDPLETVDLSRRRPGLLDALRTQLDDHHRSHSSRVGRNREIRKIDAEMEERLRTLGYIE